MTNSPQRLLTVEQTAKLFGVGKQTIRDWTHAGILVPIRLPGSLIRDDNGQVIAKPRERAMKKHLFDIRDLDALIDRLKAEQQ